MPKNNTCVLMSIKDRYVQKILSGEKTAEIRRSFSPRKKVSRVYVYIPSPKKKIVGYFEIKEIRRMPIGELWQASGKESSLSQEEFFGYLSGKDNGTAIHFENFIVLKKTTSFRELKTQFSNFHPPQSFIYVPAEMETFILK